MKKMVEAVQVEEAVIISGVLVENKDGKSHTQSGDTT
jgi:hypothetical protein